MIRWLAPALLVLSMLTATAAAEPVRTYAYISHVDATTTGMGADFQKTHCTFTVKIPRTALDHAPQGSGSELLTGATTAHQSLVTEPVDEFDCGKFEHTWQLVSFDPDHRDSLIIGFPHGSVDWLQVIAFSAIGLIVISYMLEKLTGKSLSVIGFVLKFDKWRWARRQARNDKELAKIRADRLARAQVVETKHDAPSD